MWQRGRYWHEADPDDLLDWEAWRRRGQQPGRGIGGSKWQRELAALRLVYGWAEKEQRIERSPVLVHQVRLRGGGSVTVADQAPRDVRSADVKWVRRARTGCGGMSGCSATTRTASRTRRGGAVTTAEAAAAPGLPAGEAARPARPIITAMAAAAIRVAVFGKG